MEFEVKFLEEDTTIRETNLVVVEVRHLLHSLLMTEYINTYQTGSHVKRMLKAHAWKIEMQRMINKVESCVVRKET